MACGQVEDTFRDRKDPRLGLGLKQTVIKRYDRRDVFYLLATIAHSPLTLLGQAGRDLGVERWLVAGPVGCRTFELGTNSIACCPA